MTRAIRSPLTPPLPFSNPRQPITIRKERKSECDQILTTQVRVPEAQHVSKLRKNLLQEFSVNSGVPSCCFSSTADGNLLKLGPQISKQPSVNGLTLRPQDYFYRFCILSYLAKVFLYHLKN